MMRYSLPKRGPYRHPGRLFLEQYGIPTHEDDVIKFADFLREQARAGKYPPIRLRAIRWHFGIRLAIESLPLETPGFTDHINGIIFVRREDTRTRQRFSEAHEMIELLYGVCEESSEWDKSIFAGKPEHHKERLCHKGAAALLMPKQAFLEYLDKAKPSLQIASSLAGEFRTSFTATVHRMVSLSPNQCAMIIWHTGPTVDKDRGALQIRWAETSNGMDYPVAGQDIGNESLVWKAYETGQVQVGFESLSIGSSPSICEVEAKRVTLGNTQCVLSLIRPLLTSDNKITK